jgi:hypothetical protein
MFGEESDQGSRSSVIQADQMSKNSSGDEKLIGDADEDVINTHRNHESSNKTEGNDKVVPFSSPY